VCVVVKHHPGYCWGCTHGRVIGLVPEHVAKFKNVVPHDDGEGINDRINHICVADVLS